MQGQQYNPNQQYGQQPRQYVEAPSYIDDLDLNEIDFADDREEKTKKYLFWLPPLLRVLGILILVGTIAVLLPMSIPQIMGMQTYDITSGSMEPEIPVGSLVVVQPVEPKTLEEGEVIAFAEEGSTIVHRVVRNQTVEGKVYTKGDANDREDKLPAAYINVLGKVVFTVPVLGALSGYLTTIQGKIYAGLFIACGVLLCVLANQLSSRRKTMQAKAS